MASADPKIRLYRSALNDVRYVYGEPVAFSTDEKLLDARNAEKDRLVDAAAARADRIAA